MPKPANNRPRAESDPLSKWLQPNGVETPQEREARPTKRPRPKRLATPLTSSLKEKAELSKKKRKFESSSWR
ncbi:SubName: Full=Related to guanine nucleotide-binding protein alpha-4 subunit {ECO:0000313/EMBL:CCA75894.1} [Serendipita indica DSM 11827]|nr:SubName: Full=Related to guanine nucleotide-binding protein alpha-4 subunit {ECO:0000313/EMBL:CCA75894.1} [Serendipita indica DSM 11827]